MFNYLLIKLLPDDVGDQERLDDVIAETAVGTFNANDASRRHDQEKFRRQPQHDVIKRLPVDQ